jgi:hypothetical protein
MYPNVSFEDQVEDQDLKTQSLDSIQNLLIMVTLKMFPMNANTPESRAVILFVAIFCHFTENTYLKKILWKTP